MVKKIVKKGVSKGSAAAIGVGLAVVGAGAYAMFGPNGKANQKKAKAWMAKMEKEVQAKLVKVKTVSGPVYAKAVDALSAQYARQYKDHAGDIKAFAKDLKTKWKSVKTSSVVKKVKSTVKKAKSK
ncbi:MAG: hypothetical protein AB198_00910 [Parcubacteria bacterium C7867-003]|nr:MAG: hypothetical protein AB198_00910 [Parcubacteria bacterium C7867-003]